MSELVSSQDFLSIFKAARRFPCVVTNGISFSFDEVPVSLALFLVARDCFYLVFFFTFNKVRGGFMKLGPWVLVSQ